MNNTPSPVTNGVVRPDVEPPVLTRAHGLLSPGELLTDEQRAFHRTGNLMADTGPLLQGLHVVDLASWIAGPAAATVLSDFGADVIKVEPPGIGDTYRYFSRLPLSPHVPGFNCSWQMDNRNKRSIASNLTSAASRSVLERLVKWADVLVTNFPPPTRPKFDLEYD